MGHWSGVEALEEVRHGVSLMLSKRALSGIYRMQHVTAGHKSMDLVGMTRWDLKRYSRWLGTAVLSKGTSAGLPWASSTQSSLLG